VPNPGEALAELGRVLRPGGIAGFAEPGPNHSRGQQSQFEIRNFRTVENDIVIQDIWEAARRAGFTDLRLALFTAEPLFVSLDQFEASLQAGRSRALDRLTFRQMSDLRLFFPHKGPPAPKDSRQGDGLRADLRVELADTRVREGGAFSIRVVARNVGEAVWLP